MTMIEEGNDASRETKDGKPWSNRIAELEAELARLSAERELIIAEGQDELARCVAGLEKSEPSTADRIRSVTSRT